MALTVMDEQSNAAFRAACTDIFAGTLGGMATVIIGHPLDTVKVRMQTLSTYKSMADCIAATWNREGWRGFYKGVQSPLAGEAAFNAVQFFAYGQSKNLIMSMRSYSTESQLTTGDHYIAGGLTGAAACSIECPVDLVKSQLQTAINKANPQYRTFMECIRYIVAQRGLAGLYQGLGPTFSRTIPSTAVYFGSYEQTRVWFTKPGASRDELPAQYVLLAGGIGGIAYWLSTYPFDCIKSAIQSDEIEPGRRKYQGFMHCFKSLYAEGGIRRLYRGLSPCLLRAVPANAACFGVYEWVKGSIER